MKLKTGFGTMDRRADPALFGVQGLRATYTRQGSDSRRERPRGNEPADRLSGAPWPVQTVGDGVGIGSSACRA